MGFLSNFFSPQQRDVTDTTQSQRSPFEAFAPALQSLGGSISGAAGVNPASFIAGFNPDQQAGFQGVRDFAGTNPNLAAAQGALQGGLGFQNPFTAQQGQFAQQALGPGLAGLQQTAAGGLGTDPSAAIQGALNPAFERFQQDVLPGIASTFSGAGRLRGGDSAAGNVAARASGAFGRGITDVAGGLALNARQQDLNRQFGAQGQLSGLGFQNLGFAGQGARGDVGTQLGALGGLGQVNQQALAPSQALLGIGGQQQAQQQAVLNAPFSVGGQIGGIAGPLAAQFGQQTGSETNQFFGPSPFSQVAGGALGLASLIPGLGGGGGGGSFGGFGFNPGEFNR